MFAGMKQQKNEIIEKNGALMFSNHYLLKLLWPLFVEQLLIFAVGLIDSIMVASVGEAAVSAVSLVDSLMVLLITILTAMATGGAVVVGQYLGQGKPKEGQQAGDQLILFCTLLSVLIIAIMYIFKNFLLHLIFGDIDEDVMQNCNIYYVIVMASLPFNGLYNAGAALFRSVGNSKTPMYVSFLMNGINVAGNALLIFGFHCGVEGVAIPTLVSRIVAAAIILIFLRNKDLEIHLSRHPVFKPEWNLIRKILKIGIPNSIENSMFQLGKLILLSLISGFGTPSIAANAVGNAVALIAILPGMSMGYGVVSVISQCVGAGDYLQVRYYAKKLLLWIYAAMAVTNGLILLICPWIIKIYGLSAETGQIASTLILIHAGFAILIWPLSFSIPHVLRAAGDVTFTMIISVASMWVFRICFGVLIGKYLGMGVVGVWLAMIIDWAFRSLCFCIRYHGGKWKHPAVA